MRPKLNCTLILLALNMLLFTHAGAQSFSWAQGLSGTGSYGTGVAMGTTDAAGNIYTVGSFGGTVDFDRSSGTYNLTAVSNLDLFILKEDALGNLIWVKQVVGLSSSVYGCFGHGIDVDQNGNVFITGAFRDSFDFDPGPASYKLYSYGGYHSFVLKLDASGDFNWVGDMGSQFPTPFVSLTTAKRDKFGYIYFAAGTTGNGTTPMDVDPGSGVYNITPNFGDLLLEKLDSNGNFIWAKLITGTDGKTPTGLDFDSASNVFITGHFLGSADFDPGPGVFTLTAGTFLDQDIFVAKYDSAGNFNWAHKFGNSSTDWGTGLSIDPFGNALVTGYFGNIVDFDPGPGVYNLTSNSTRSIFTLKLRNNGDFAWARMAGASVGLFAGTAIATDSTGNVYTTGLFPLTCDFDPGPGTYNLTSNGSYDAFIQKLDSSGNFLWAGSFGGANPNVGDIPTWIGLDHDNSIYVTGVLGGSCDMDPGPDVHNVTVSANSGFILKLCQSAMALNLTASADTACSGDTILLTATAVTGASYHWYKGGSMLADTSSSIQVTTTGSYIVEVNDGCRVYDTVNVTFLPAAAPTISLPGNTLYFAVGQPVTVVASVINGGSGYAIDWYKNGVLFSTTFSNWVSYGKGAGTDTIVAVIRYAVNNPCYLPDTSNAAIIGVIDHVAKTAATRIAIAPNPSDGVFTLTAPYAIEQIQVTDIAGKEVYSAAPNSMKAVINLQDKASGVYFYTATIRGNKLRGKLVRK